MYPSHTCAIVWDFFPLQGKFHMHQWELNPQPQTKGGDTIWFELELINTIQIILECTLSI